jgi:thiol-disulfide isomerase/thioredoxin
MMPLGTQAPTLQLPDGDGRIWSLEDFEAEPALLVAFICNHCPFVKHIRQGLADFARDYRGRGLAVIAVNSNDVDTHPEDGPELMAQEAREAGYVFPYVYDETQDAAKAYGAACTPDFFLFDVSRRLVYRGQFDSSRPGNGISVTGGDLRQAVDAVLAGRPVSEDQKPSIGCNIKWRPGNAPAHAS